MTKDRKPFVSQIFYGWIIVGICVVLGFVGTGLFSFSNGIFLPSLADSLADGSRMQISIGFSGVAVVSALISPALGRYLDRHSPRRVMLIGAAVLALSYLLLATVQTVWQFYLVVGLGFGVGISFLGTITRNRSVLYWFDHWRGRAVGIAVLGASFSGIVFPPVVNALIETGGWRSSYIVFAVANFVILTPLIYFLMKDRPEEIGEVRDGHRYVTTHDNRQADDPQDSKQWTVRELLLSVQFWSIGGIFGPMVCVYYAIMVHLYGHLLDRGLSPGEAAFVLSFTALFSAIGKPILGFLADFIGARSTIWMSLLAQAVALYGFTLADTYWQSVVAAAIYGFGYSGLTPLRTFAVSTSIGSSSLGVTSGLLRWVELPFVLLASPLAGFVHDATGSYNLAFMTLASLLIASCIGPFFIRAGGAWERHKQQVLKEVTVRQSSQTEQASWTQRKA